MASGVSDDQSLSKRLYYLKGWRQGSIFVLPGATVLVNAPNKAGEESGVQIYSLPREDTELLIIASQDCDIISDAEPNVEALVCKVDPTEESRIQMRNVLRGSARSFVVDRDRGIVADSQRRMIVSKELLETTASPESVMPPETLGEFANWLAWRFNRPAISDEHVDHIQRPLKDAVKKMEKQDAEQLTTFSEVVKEVRIRYPTEDSKEVTLFLVLKDIEPSATQADAIQYVCEKLKRAINKVGHYSLTYEAEPYSEVGLRAYQATQPLNLEYITRWGDELTEPTGVFRTRR